MKITLQTLSVLILLCSSVLAAYAQEVYMTPEEFIANHIPEVTEAKSLWVTGDIRAQAEKVLGHRPLSLRQRYWQTGTRTVWILEEIGKEEPITTGFAVENGQIVDTQVLIFRESRGWEIHYPSFTAQFNETGMSDELQLDRSIDGISGATLSVNAMRKMAKLALTYDKHVNTEAHSAVLGQQSQPRDTGL